MSFSIRDRIYSIEYELSNAQLNLIHPFKEFDLFIILFMCVICVCSSDSNCIYLYDFRYFRLFEFRKIVSNRELCYKLIPPDYPVEITKVTKTNANHVPSTVIILKTKVLFLRNEQNKFNPKQIGSITFNPQKFIVF